MLTKSQFALGLGLFAAVLFFVAPLSVSARPQPTALLEPRSPECKICAGMVHVGWAMVKTYNSSVTIMSMLAREGCQLFSDPEHRHRCTQSVKKFQKVNHDVVQSVSCNLHNVCDDTGFCKGKDGGEEEDFDVFVRAQEELRQSPVRVVFPEEEDMMMMPEEEPVTEIKGSFSNEKTTAQKKTAEKTAEKTKKPVAKKSAAKQAEEELVEQELKARLEKMRAEKDAERVRREERLAAKRAAAAERAAERRKHHEELRKKAEEIRRRAVEAREQKREAEELRKQEQEKRLRRTRNTRFLDGQCSADDHDVCPAAVSRLERALREDSRAMGTQALFEELVRISRL